MTGTQSQSLVVSSTAARSQDLKISSTIPSPSRVSIASFLVAQILCLESQIVSKFLGEALKDEAMKIAPVQKQTQAGQRTRFKAVVIVGDSNGHLGLGVKCAKEVQTAVKGALVSAKLNLVPIRRGYWGNNIGKPHTVPVKVHGKSGSVRIRLIPAPRGAGIVASPTPKKVLQFAGIEDVYTSTQGNTKTKENSLKATFDALTKTYRYLTPDLWLQTPKTQLPFERFHDEPVKVHGKHDRY
jgi:small subunit ribosomal protein S2e